MDGMIPDWRFADKQKLIRRMPQRRDARLKTRYLLIVNLFARSPTQTAAALPIARSTVYAGGGTLSPIRRIGFAGPT